MTREILLTGGGLRLEAIQSRSVTGFSFEKQDMLGLVMPTTNYFTRKRGRAEVMAGAVYPT
jgi:hypothetical protein